MDLRGEYIIALLSNQEQNMNTAAACRSYPNDVRPDYDDPSRIEKALEGADEKRPKDGRGSLGTRAVRGVLLK